MLVFKHTQKSSYGLSNTYNWKSYKTPFRRVGHLSSLHCFTYWSLKTVCSSLIWSLLSITFKFGKLSVSSTTSRSTEEAMLVEEDDSSGEFEPILDRYIQSETNNIDYIISLLHVLARNHWSALVRL